MTTKPVPRPEDSNNPRRLRRRGTDSAEGVNAAVEGGALEESDPERGLDEVAPREDELNDEEDDSLVGRGAPGALDVGPLPGLSEDDDLGIDFEPEEEKSVTEAMTEIDRAKVMDTEMKAAFEKARNKSIVELRARGGNVDYKIADKAGADAADRVRRRHMLGKPRGFYAMEPFVATDVDGKSVTFPIDARIPVAVLQRLGKAQVKKLIKDKVIEDLR